jgi:hypothetical protein
MKLLGSILLTDEDGVLELEELLELARLRG